MFWRSLKELLAAKSACPADAWQKTHVIIHCQVLRNDQVLQEKILSSILSFVPKI